MSSGCRFFEEHGSASRDWSESLVSAYRVGGACLSDQQDRGWFAFCRGRQQQQQPCVYGEEKECWICYGPVLRPHRWYGGLFPGFDQEVGVLWLKHSSSTERRIPWHFVSGPCKLSLSRSHQVWMRSFWRPQVSDRLWMRCCLNVFVPCKLFVHSDP